MLTLRRVLVLPFVLLMASTLFAAGQQHLVAPDQLASAVADRVAQQDADRAAVHEALARPEVREGGLVDGR